MKKLLISKVCFGITFYDNDGNYGNTDCPDQLSLGNSYYRNINQAKLAYDNLGNCSKGDTIVALELYFTVNGEQWSFLEIESKVINCPNTNSPALQPLGVDFNTITG